MDSYYVLEFEQIQVRLNIQRNAEVEQIPIWKKHKGTDTNSDKIDLNIFANVERNYKRVLFCTHTGLQKMR